MLENNFYCGLAYGLTAAGILGFILRRIREARTKMGKSKKPLNTFPASEQPNLTPGKIVRSSIFSTVGCFFWAIIFILVVAMLAYYSLGVE